MKVLTIKNSLVKRIMYVYGPLYKHRKDIDICTATSAFLRGLVVLFVTSVLLFCGAICAGDTLGWLIAGINHGFVKPEVYAFIFMMIVGMVAITFMLLVIVSLGIHGTDLINRRRQAKAAANGVEYLTVGEAFDAWKSKYCFRVICED